MEVGDVLTLHYLSLWYQILTFCVNNMSLRKLTGFFFPEGLDALWQLMPPKHFFIAVCHGDLWSAIWMQAALTKLTWTNIYLQQSTGNCSCRLLFIYSSLAQASCSLPVFGHLLISEVNTRVSSNFLKAKLYLQKRSLYPSHRYGQI